MGSLALRETFKSFFTSWRGPLPKGMVPEQKPRKFMIAQKRVEGIFLVWAILAPWALLEPYLTKSAQPCFPIIFYCVFSPKNCKKRNKRTTGQS